ncbi:MAG: hypothetical protein H0W72_02985 [Planctomycetes bacterium]|nr:hypothetical protein [Planctomycetota bacterium]
MRIIAVIVVMFSVATAQAADAERFAWADDLLAGVVAGELRLACDLRELPTTGLLHARQAVPVRPGALILDYPRWVPGVHAPSGPVRNLGGVAMHTAAGVTVAWERDRRDPWRFHVTVPDGVEALLIDLTYIANQPDENSEGVDVQGGPEHAVLNWNCCLLVPEQADLATWSITAAARLPDGWTWAGALEAEPGDAPRFAALSIAELVDRPIIAGPRVQRVPLHPGGPDGPPMDLEILIQDADAWPCDERWMTGLRRLPSEAYALFGGAFYDRYHALLLAGSPGIGLEHGHCSLNGIDTGTLRDFDAAKSWYLELIPHEYVHSWVGKHRRPAGMLTGDFRSDPDLDGLWIYEGLTEYLGTVLAARSGLNTPAAWRDQLAEWMDSLATMPGRQWRSVRDTCRCSWQLRAYSRSHQDLRRGQDYYIEGAVFWLAADLAIRQRSGGARSLDDLCRAFFGPAAKAGGFSEAELIAALTAVAEVDWSARVRRWIDTTGTLDTGFLAGNGWRLRTDAVVDPDDALLARVGPQQVRSALGVVAWAGHVREVDPGSPADLAGLESGDFIHSVGGHELKTVAHAWARAIVASTAQGGVVCRLKRGGEWTQLVLPYRDGLRLPRLERSMEEPDVLGAILAPRTWNPAALIEPGMVPVEAPIEDAAQRELEPAGR